jgi:hypothetical protein
MLSVQQNLSVRYRNTFWDLLSFCSYEYLHSTVAWVFNGFVFAIITLFFWPFFGLSRQIGDFVVLGIIEFVVFCFLAALAVSIVFLNVLACWNENRLIERTTILRESSFVDETAQTENETSWDRIEKLARTKNYLFVFIPSRLTSIIPRRAFRNDVEWDAFYEFCRERTTNN